MAKKKTKSKPKSTVKSTSNNIDISGSTNTANELPLFSGYTIKIVMSGTNQAYPPRIKELRTIAIR